MNPQPEDVGQRALRVHPFHGPLPRGDAEELPIAIEMANGDAARARGVICHHLLKRELRAGWHL